MLTNQALTFGSRMAIRQPVEGSHTQAALPMKVVFSRTASLRAAFACAFGTLVLVRMLNIDGVFSYDYGSYLFILERISRLSFSDILTHHFVFPYVETDRTAPIELGFALLVKSLSVLRASPETSLAILAAASVCLRVYVMDSFGVPKLWSVVLNTISITLFEANAIRLGIGVSLLLFGIYSLSNGRKATGFWVIGIAATMHLQILMFAVPFLIFLIFATWLTRSKARVLFILAGFSLAAAAFSQLLPLLNNVKVNEYVARGFSASSGLSVTSALAVMFIASSTFLVLKSDLRTPAAKVWLAVLAGAAPSVVLLITMTDVAVIGDRAWQVAYTVSASLFFLNWLKRGQKGAAYLVMVAITITILFNVMVRFPLSNFASPPFPTISAPWRY